MGQLPQSEVIEGAIRKENRLVPEITIRELVANALIHQDFSIGGASMIVEIYANRVEISNPGEPIVPVERFIDGYQSRNERLADLMRRMGICEEKSSGIGKMQNLCTNAGIPKPVFREFQQGFQVEFSKDIYTEEYLSGLRLNERQIKAVMYVKERGRITNKEYQELTNMSRQTATIDLSEMVKKNIFERIGKAGKGIAYQLP